MLFSSPIFLFLFLPLTLLGYFLNPRGTKNYWLLLTSLIFFAWGGVSYTAILIGSIILNHGFGLLIQRNIDRPSGYRWLVAGVAANVALLGVFKYTDFIIANLNGVSGLFAAAPIPATKILLPVGISFYTFHSLSYLVDIYRRKVVAQRNILDLALYISMFSQLVAGPIIRYSDVWEQLRGRVHTVAKFSSGVERFLLGLGKKVLLANTFARVADQLLGSELGDLNALNAWLAIVCYSLQIYYDFSGYSDMAIGLGRMFGFEFQENFNFPYLARSVKEFWRRWHISLSTFFRDYVYIPLGGNRIGVRRMYINLMLVFLLTGFWHGASWNFVLWGLLHGAAMLLERLGLEKWLGKAGRLVGTGYTLLVVMLAWVLFRCETLPDALQVWRGMFQFRASDGQSVLFMEQMGTELYIAMAVGLLGAFGFFRWLARGVTRLQATTTPAATVFSYVFHVASVATYAGILVLSATYLIAGSYNPFIYYRF
jgi:alginate O-acetyltransferase complex protein AlgI